MKKNLIKFSFLIATFFCTQQTFAQVSYGVGANVLNLGIGFGNTITYGVGVSSSPVISGSFEHGVSKLGPGTLGIGGIISYQATSYNISDVVGTWKEKWTTTYIALRGTWHPDILVADKYDVYGALDLGYTNYGYSVSGTGGYYERGGSSGLNNGLGFGLVVGGRYYLSKHIALFGELGYDICALKIGASVKF